MNTIKSTAEILAYKVLNRNIDETWVNWAVEMLMNDFETEHLLILAGISSPFDQFYLIGLTNKVFEELKLDYSDKDRTIKNYACYLVERCLNGQEKPMAVLSILKDIYIELDMASYLSDFYMLYFAKKDLLYGEMQWYWNNANRNNIDSIITDQFIKWKTDNC